MAVTANAGAGSYSRAVAAPTLWTFCGWFKQTSFAVNNQPLPALTDGGGGIAYVKAEDGGGGQFVEFIDNTSTNNFNVAVTGAPSTWYFMAMRWAGGVAKMEFLLREQTAGALTLWDSEQDGLGITLWSGLYNPRDAEQSQAGKSFANKGWLAYLSDEELLRESQQFSPVRWENLIDYYRLANAAAAAAGLVTSLTITGTLGSDAGELAMPHAQAVVCL